MRAQKWHGKLRALTEAFLLPHAPLVMLPMRPIIATTEKGDQWCTLIGVQ